MIDSASYSATSDDTHTLFGQTMGWVAATAGCFSLGAYLDGVAVGGLPATEGARSTG